MSLALTDIDAVRQRGALDAPPVAGAISDAQIEAAILLAATRMREVAGYDLYLTVQGITDGDTTQDGTNVWTLGQKKDDFIAAESYLALARLAPISQLGKMTESGTPMTSQIGREVKTFAPAQETSDSAATWEREAYRVLAPYIGDVLAPPADQFTGRLTRVTTSNQKLRIALI